MNQAPTNESSPYKRIKPLQMNQAPTNESSPYKRIKPLRINHTLAKFFTLSSIICYNYAVNKERIKYGTVSIFCHRDGKKELIPFLLRGQDEKRYSS